MEISKGIEKQAMYCKFLEFLNSSISVRILELKKFTV